MQFRFSLVLLAISSLSVAGCSSIGRRAGLKKHAPAVRLASDQSRIAIPESSERPLQAELREQPAELPSVSELDPAAGAARLKATAVPSHLATAGPLLSHMSNQVSVHPLPATFADGKATLASQPIDGPVIPASASIEPDARIAQDVLNRSPLIHREPPLASRRETPVVAPAPEVADTPSTVPPTASTNVAASEPPSDASTPRTLAIDLATALELTTGQNPQVNYAREKIRESLAKLDGANALWLPSLRAGANYHKHEGRIQDVAGTIIETSRNSVYNGFGAQAVGAGSPAVPGVLMNFHVRDSLFQPRIAGQVVGATRQASRIATNDMLLETAVAYCDLLEAKQLQVIADETQANTLRLAKLTSDYASAGQGLPSDADRSSTELAFRKVESQRAFEQVRVRSARLARLLSRDPQVVLEPAEPFLAPVELIDAETELASLVAQGLSSRPELVEQQYLVGEAVERLQRERYAPLVPSVLLGLSYGGNGGGLGSDFENYGDRMDFDAAAFWEIRNLGVGERAARCEAQSRLRQARYRQVQALDRIAAEIVEAEALVQAKRDQISSAESAITAAKDSYRRNQERILNAQGLPIEVLQSITALDQAQRLYATTIADYNRAQFRLYRALGFAVMDAP